jgi:hypothetical protein
VVLRNSGEGNDELFNCGFEKSWPQEERLSFWLYGRMHKVVGCHENTLYMSQYWLRLKRMSSNFMRRIDINLDIEQIVGVWNWWRELSGFSIPKKHFQQLQGEVSTHWICTEQRNPSFTRIMSWYFVSMNSNISKTKFHKIFEINLNFCLYKVYRKCYNLHYKRILLPSCANCT